MKNNISEYILKHNRKKDENLKYDFMPDILEIIEKPANAAGKVIIWSIVTFLFLAVLWAGLSKSDIVVIGEGFVEPAGTVIAVQAKAGGSIAEVYKSNGAYVKKGELVAKEDTVLVDIDIAEAKQEMHCLEAENEIYRKVLAGEDLTGISPESYEESLADNIRYLLMQENYFRDSLSDNEEDYVKRLREQHNITVLEKIIRNKDRIKELNSVLGKAEKNQKNQMILAEESGYITNMQEGLTGRVIEEGEKLFDIVPENTEMRVQCYIGNADIGELRTNQRAEIKVDSYPYSDYGTLEGTITYISQNTISTPEKKDVYQVTVTLDQIPENIRLIAGMNCQVEVKTGTRTLLKYFLDPVTGAIGSAMKEP